MLDQRIVSRSVSGDIGEVVSKRTVRVREILVGTLAIDMVDAKTKQMAWRGLGTKEVDTKAKPDKRDENINKAVAKIFKNYPPKVGE